jgi:hypothetical protein
MSLHTVGSDAHYILPASFDSVPEAFRSNKTSKPIPCSLQTVNVPALSGNQTLGGSSIVQIPCGAGAGILMNPYIRFTLQMTGGTSTANGSWSFKGAAQAATACINRLSTYVNSVQIDNQQNAWALYDTVLTHSTSADWLNHDGSLLLGSGVPYFNTVAAATESKNYTFVVPLLGLLGSQQAMPLYLVNGTLQVQIDWASSVYQIYTAGTNDPVFTNILVQNVQIVYDKIMPEEAFVSKVRQDMMGGQKYVFGYTNFSTTVLPMTFAASGGTLNLNYGLNVSSLRGVVMAQYPSSTLSTSGSAPSISNCLSGFQVSLDGRLISSLQLNTNTDPSLVFAEMNKAFGRIFDASITDLGANSATAAAAVSNSNASGGTFLTNYWAAGASCQRVNEGLCFQGSPCSILNVQLTWGGSAGSITQVSSTNFIVLISDFQLLIDATGSVEIVR